MGKRGKPYTKEEEAIIIEEIHNYPNNLKHAFEEAASRLPGRKSSAVAGYYYSKLKNREQALIAMATPQGVMTNVKNSPRRVTGKVQMMRTFLDMMSPDEKKEIAKYIFEEL